MNGPFVVDSGPFIILAKIGRLDLLSNLATDAIVTNQVAREIRRYGLGDPARAALDAGIGMRARVTYVPAAVRRWNPVGLGETLVLAYALRHIGSTVVLDDAKARSIADALAIPKIGTLGIVLRAKTLGVIEAANPVVKDMLRSGIFLGDNVIREALQALGEDWP